MYSSNPWMERKELIGLLALKAMLLIGSISCSGQKIDTTRDAQTNTLNQHTDLPNVLLIMVDDLGYGDLSCMGAKDLKSPNIDKIANEGIKLTSFYANSPVCSPSRASLLTGMYPDIAGVPGVIRQSEDNSHGFLRTDVSLISDEFKKAGYHTALIGKWHLGLESPNIPNERGFDLFKGFLGDRMDDYYTHSRMGKNWMRHNQEVIKPKGHATDVFTNWTMDYLNARKNEKEPFFLYLAYNAPHYPIQPPKEYLDKVIAREKGIQENRAKNVAFVEHLDAAIGKVMNTLEKSGMKENTIVIFTSDNGGSLKYAQSNGELRGGKQDMYEGGIRVPFLMSWPNIVEENRVSESPMMLMDIFPTLFDMVGLPMDGNRNGRSQKTFILETTTETEMPFSIWVRREGGSRYGGLIYYAARKGNYKLVQNTPYEPLKFFDIVNDPLEKTELYMEQSEIAEELRYLLQKHIINSGSIPWQKQGQ